MRRPITCGTIAKEVTTTFTAIFTRKTTAGDRSAPVTAMLSAWGAFVVRGSMIGSCALGAI